MSKILSCVTVIGSTATGKSDLAVRLAKNCNGQVINADSMQVYKGLDIITNKISDNEKLGIKHHLMSFLDKDKEYSIPQFQQDAHKLITEFNNNNSLPIIAGGTHYYIQHLLFSDTLIATPKEITHKLTDTPHSNFDNIISILNDYDKSIMMNLPYYQDSNFFDVDDSNTPLYVNLYRILNTLDPKSGSRWHVKDFRKVKRSLEIMWETGRLRSEIESEQKEQNKQSQVKYRNLVFWVYTDPQVLTNRLEKRVEKMTKQGLLEEIEEMRSLENKYKIDGEQDYTRGLFQAIGYKEFDGYFKATNEAERERALQLGIDQMKIATRRYALRQLKWIQNKLLPEIISHQTTANAEGIDSNIDIYVVDSSDASKWEENVCLPAQSIMEKFLNNEQLPNPKTISEIAENLFNKQSKMAASNAQSDYKKVVCEICTIDHHNPIMLNEGMEYENHLRSRAHKSRARPKLNGPPEDIEERRRLKRELKGKQGKI